MPDSTNAPALQRAGEGEESPSIFREAAPLLCERPRSLAECHLPESFSRDEVPSDSSRKSSSVLSPLPGVPARLRPAPVPTSPEEGIPRLAPGLRGGDRDPVCVHSTRVPPLVRISLRLFHRSCARFSLRLALTM